MRYAALSLVALSLLATACNNSTTTGTTITAKTDTVVKVTPPPAAPAKPAESNLAPNATQALVDLTQTYLKLKDAMVAADTTEADASAAKLMSAAESMHLELSYMKDKRTKMLLQMDTIAKQSETLANIKNDKNCDSKRVPFEKISDVLYAVVKDAQLKNVPLYREYCPMAFDSKGAFWISAEEEIRNPYFGKKMLDCGEVTDTLNR